MKFQYTNYKGETEIRNVTPVALEWMAVPGFDYQPGLFLRAWDRDREAHRSFRLDDRFVPTADMEGDPGGTVVLYVFPTEEQATLADIQSTVLALVGKLDGSTLVQYQPHKEPAKAQMFYRHKHSEPGDTATGPVDDLPEIVRVNRDMYEVWEVIGGL